MPFMALTVALAYKSGHDYDLVHDIFSKGGVFHAPPRVSLGQRMCFSEWGPRFRDPFDGKVAGSRFMTGSL